MNKHLHAPELTDKVILDAFCGTNFGRTDYREFLAYSVLKKACGWHCGYTITCIMVNLGLITPKTLKVTKLGKLFLTDSYPDPMRKEKEAAASPAPIEAVSVARSALDYIDALPADVVAALPAMPGFDRDWAENVLSGSAAE